MSPSSAPLEIGSGAASVSTLAAPATAKAPAKRRRKTTTKKDSS